MAGVRISVSVGAVLLALSVPAMCRADPAADVAATTPSPTTPSAAVTPPAATTAPTPPAPAAATANSETPAAPKPDAAPVPPAPPATNAATPPAATAPAAAPVQAAAPQKPQLGALVRAKLDARAADASEAETSDAAALKAFYVARGDQPLWISDTALNDRAVLAIAEIKKANDWGLDAGAFDLPDAKGTLSEEAAADAELKMSLAALTYARHARGGRIDNPATQLSSYLDRMPQLLDPKIVLDKLAAAATPDATLRGFHPQHPQFERLRQRYLALQKSKDEATHLVIIPKGPVISPGQKNAQVPLLRQRLQIAAPAGTAEAPADDTVYDAALVDAVKAFQTAGGLAPDGVVGNGTRASLNDFDIPSPDKVRANMEMWRWVPDDLGATHVWVNLPSFTFQFVRAGKVVHEERIITGLVDKQTPIFTADMDMVTAHPRWNVPDSIKVRELYPSLARGGTYFEKQGLRMTKNGRPVDPYYVDWGSSDIRKFDVHQPPGPANVLGLFKFTFHNKHIVYMHDTPTKHLFERPSRPFSHGCVRVRNPQRLAELVLEADKGWTPEQVAELVSGQPVENPIPLSTKIPVHLVYFTEEIDDAGEVHRYKDVYGHEERMMLALAGRFDAIAKAPDHLAPVKYSETRYTGGGNPLETFMNNLFGGF
jgi:L,D-transpeptidase YcbB